MRTSLLLVLFMLVACSYNKTAPAYNQDSVLAQPSQERNAADVPGESPDSVLQLEAIIERNLYKMGLPSLQDERSSFALNSTSDSVGAGISAGAVKDPSAVLDPKPQDAVPPSPKKEVSKIEANSTPKPTAPIAAENKNKGEEKKDREQENSSCQKTCTLIDNICDASERICQITEKLPKDSEAPLRCTRARNACTRAQTQGASCPCSS